MADSKNQTHVNETHALLSSCFFYDLPSAFASVTPQLFAELYALAFRYGYKDDNARRITLHAPGAMNIMNILIGTKEDLPICMMVSPTVSMVDLILSDYHRLCVYGPGLAPKQLLIGWHKSISVEDAHAFLHEAERLIANNPDAPHIGVKPEEYCVATVFENPMTTMPIFPPKDPEDVRQRFDHPELVAIHEDSFGLPYLYLANSVHLHEQREAIALEVLRKHGIDKTEEAMSSLTWEKILDLRKEIAETLRASHN